MKVPAALAAFAALTVAAATCIAPASAARGSYVVDDAHMLSQTAIAQIDRQVGSFNAQTGKEVVVVTTPSLDGTSPNAALERSFAQQQVNGVEIFIAKNEKQIKIAGDTASRQFFPSGSFSTIYQAMRPYFAQGNYDQGVETGVSLIVNTYLGHTSSLHRARQPVGAGSASRSSTTGGFGMGFIWWIIILAVIFFIIRGIFRAMAGPRMYGGGPGYGAPGGPGGPGYGPGYGGGYGYGGGGGFWSGLLGGLGGAWLGNELFGGRGGGFGGEGGSWAGTGGVDPGSAADAGGWQSDAGQIDTGNIGGGGWGGGDSGGGFGGDSGGGWGGGDGGGGGDSGGGW